MSLSQTMQVYDALSSAKVSGASITAMFDPFKNIGVKVETKETPFEQIPGQSAPTAGAAATFVKISIPGGKKSARTLGIIGRLGGIGARPQQPGLVSDADGAIAAIATALKLAQMKLDGDSLPGDVIVTAHISSTVPINKRSDGVVFLGMPVKTETMNDYQIAPEMTAILSLDTSKGNRLTKQRGFSISPTVMQGVILPVSGDLVRIMEASTGKIARTFPVSQHDITPYHNKLKKFNSIMQPAIGTDKPVVGVAITAESVVFGDAFSASHETDIAEAVKFAVAVAYYYTNNDAVNPCNFYDESQWTELETAFPQTVRSMTNFKGTYTSRNPWK